MQVDMICVNATGFNKPVRIVFPHFLDSQRELLGYSFGEDFSPVSGNPYDVILGLIYRMCLSMQFHAGIIS